jgi:ATP-dependent RNA helicase DDX5/DBP2
LVELRKDFYRVHPDVAARSWAEVQDTMKQYDITVKDPSGRDDYPKLVTTFKESGLSKVYIEALHRKFGAEGRPTPIQMQGWPIALSGRDMVGIAETGSGKTLAYLLPGIRHAAEQVPVQWGDGPIVLVLVPTRELARQIQEEAESITILIRAIYEERGKTFAPFLPVCIYGGEESWIQKSMLRQNPPPDMIVATPGRLMDFLLQRETNLNRVTYLVLDEADQMLDMGFEKDLQQIYKVVRPDRQTLMWSATWPKQVRELSLDYVNNPVQINIGSKDEDVHTCKSVKQNVEFFTSEDDKFHVI